MSRWLTLMQRARARRAGAEVVPGPPAAGARSGKVARAAPSPDGHPDGGVEVQAIERGRARAARRRNPVGGISAQPTDRRAGARAEGE